MSTDDDMPDHLENNKGKRHQWFVAIIANLPLMTYGLQMGWMSPATKLLLSPETPLERNLTDDQLTWIASIMCISALFSTPLFSFLADKRGRKIAVLGVTILQALCWAVKILFATTKGLIIARIICGLASGGCFNIVPTYTKEIAHNSIRGTLGSLLYMFQNLGYLIIYALGSYLSYFTSLYIVICIPILNTFLLLKVPETPSFLVKRGKIEKASQSLAFLRGLQANCPDIKAEIEEFENKINYFNSLPDITFANIYKNKLHCRCLSLTLLTITVQSLSGCFAILIYSSSIITSSGVEVSPQLQLLSIPAIMILGSLFSLTLVEKFRRKKLLSISLFVASSSQAVLATVIMFDNQGRKTLHWLPIITLLICVFACAAGVLPIPFIIMSEIFNFQVRAKLIGIIVTYSWFISFLQLMSFGTLSKMFGMHVIFYVFSAINLFGVFVTLVCLPETKGKTIDEIERELKTKRCFFCS